MNLSHIHFFYAIFLIGVYFAHVIGSFIYLFKCSPCLLIMLFPTFSVSPLLLFSSPYVTPPSIVLARAGIWGEGCNNRRRLHSGGAQRDHHEPPHPSGLDVPLVLSA